MWDPISIFYICYCLNVNMPDSKLTVDEVILANEKKLIKTIIKDSVKLREGV